MTDEAQLIKLCKPYKPKKRTVDTYSSLLDFHM